MIDKKYLLLLFPFVLVGYDESILKKSKIDIFNASKEMIELKASTQNHTLLANPIITYQQNQTDNKTSLGVRLEQDIFRSGGLYFKLRKTNAQLNLELDQLGVKKQQDVFSAYKTAISIKKIDLSISKQNLLLQNKELTLEGIQDKYKRGIDSISKVGNTIIELNIIKNALYALKSTREDLIKNFSLLSDKTYKDIKLWNVDTDVSKDTFIKNNNNIKIAKLDKIFKEYNTKEAISSYLPKVSIFANYNDNSVVSKTSYGFKISWMLNTGVLSGVEYAKLDMLKSTLKNQDTIEYENRVFSSLKKEIKIIQNKITNIKKNISYYKALVQDIKSKYTQGLSAKSDLITMQNIQKMSEKDLEILMLEKHLKIVNIYERFNSLQK